LGGGGVRGGIVAGTSRVKEINSIYVVCKRLIEVNEVWGLQIKLNEVWGGKCNFFKV